MSRRGAAALALALGAVLACSEAPAPGPRRDCSFVVYYQATSTVARVAVVGDFNDWSPDATPLAPVDASGLYAAVVSPAPGLHAYRLDADGVAALDPYNPLTITGADGREASAMRIADCARPALEVTSFAVDPAGALEAEVQFLRGRADQPLDPGTIGVTLGAAPVTLAAPAASGVHPPDLWDPGPKPGGGCGYGYGYDCPAPVVDCAAPACVHGTCLRADAGTGDACICDRGYAGLLCDQCAPGWAPAGLTCVATDPCAAGPCVYGTCYAQGDAFYCECQAGYAGARCDECAEGWHAENLECVPG
ncbi:MAG TPA: hypothetical protein VGQ83_19310 [Polyangia bacterium]|jgi:hypothetical protein